MAQGRKSVVGDEKNETVMLEDGDLEEAAGPAPGGANEKPPPPPESTVMLDDADLEDASDAPGATPKETSKAPPPPPARGAPADGDGGAPLRPGQATMRGVPAMPAKPAAPTTASAPPAHPSAPPPPSVPPPPAAKARRRSAPPRPSAPPPPSSRARTKSIPPPPAPGTTAPQASASPAAEAQSLLTLLQKKLVPSLAPARAARVHLDLARLHEGTRQWAKAAEHYRKAHELDAELPAAIDGARRCLISAGRHREAVALFDEELEHVPEPRTRARLLLDKGRLLEDHLEVPAKALEAYRAALELAPHDPSVLKCLERGELRAQAWTELDRTYERAVHTLREGRLRAAVTGARARLAEVRQNDAAQAASLYGVALDGDANAAGALEAVKRLAASQQRWQDLAAALVREAEQATTPTARAQALYRAALVHERELGEPERAAGLLTHATRESGELYLWRALADLHERSGKAEELVAVLSHLAERAASPRERAVLSHRLGELSETHGDPVAARRHHEAAIAVDPSFGPSVRALDALYEQAGNWEALVELRTREADSADGAEQSAEALARAAAVLEHRLDNPDAAAERYARALGFTPGHEASFDALCRLHAAAGRWRELVELYRRALDATPDDERSITWSFRIGGIYEDRLGEPEAAVHVYRQVLDRQPAHLGALQALARAAERSGRFEDVVEALEREAKLIQDKGRVVELLSRAGVVAAERLAHAGRAIELLRRVLERDPAHPPTLRALARVYRSEGRWEDVLATTKRLSDTTQDGRVRTDLLTEMGHLAQGKLGRPEQAAAYYREALDLDPEHDAALEALVDTLEARSQWTELVKTLQARVERTTEPMARAQLLVRIAELHERRLSNPDRAVQAYTSALEVVPGMRPAIDGRQRLLATRAAWRELAASFAAEADAAEAPAAAVDARYREGRVYADRMGDLERAIGSFESVLEQDPSHLGALLGLEELYARTERWDALAGVYRRQTRVLEDAGALLAAWREIARLEQRHDIGTAADRRRAYEAILELAPEDPEALEGLAEIAAESGDSDALIALDGRLASVAVEPGRIAYHCLRLAGLLEARDDPRTLEAYRRVLGADPQSLAATRGFSRAARTRGEPEALREAARHEADVMGDSAEAVALLLEAARARTSAGQLDEAAADLERALELDASHPDVAARLEPIMTALGRPGPMVDMLELAAERARPAERAAELRLRAARIQADHLSDLGAATATLERAAQKLPAYLPVLDRLADYLEQSRRYPDAAKVLHRMVQQLSDPPALEQAHMRLATLLDEHLGDAGRATASLHTVLEHNPDQPDALERLARIEARRGDHEGALAHAQRLEKLANTPAERARVLVLRARIERGRGGDASAANEALLKAVALEGPAGDAATEYKSAASSPAHWEAYIAALRQYGQQASAARLPVAPTYREIAEVLLGRLGRPDDALATLSEAARNLPGDIGMGLAHAALLHRAGRHPQAIEEARRVLALDPTSAGGWRQVAQSRQAIGDSAEATAALAPLLVIEAATPEEQSAAAMRQPRPGHGEPGALGDAMVREIQVEGAFEAPAAGLLAALPETLAKLHPPQQAAYGVSKRDRLGARSDDPLRALVDRLSMLLGVPEVDVYVHDAQVNDVGVELSHPPSLMVPVWARGLDEARQVFLLGRPLAMIARSTHVATRLTPDQIGAFLTGAARFAEADFAPPAAVPEDPDTLAQQVGRAMPRRERKSFEDAARRYAATPLPDVGRWVRAVHASAARAALLLADDLPASVDVWRRATGEQLGPGTIAADLMLFWVSTPASHYRRRG